MGHKTDHDLTYRASAGVRTTHDALDKTLSSATDLPPELIKQMRSLTAEVEVNLDDTIEGDVDI